MMTGLYTGLKADGTMLSGTLGITPLPHIQLIKISSLAKNIRNSLSVVFSLQVFRFKHYLSDLLEHIFFLTSARYAEHS